MTNPTKGKRTMPQTKRFFSLPRAFTLIELVIVVAIIAILAAIAVPNFLEAQVRSKVSRAKADIRTVATALEAYAVDNNHYPPTPFVENDILRVVPDLLSAPVSYLSTAQFSDPFLSTDVGDFEAPAGKDAQGNPTTYTWAPCPDSDPLCTDYEPKNATAGHRYYYQSNRDGRRSAGVEAALLEFSVPKQGAWIMASLGPDKGRDVVLASSPGEVDVYIPYDPTNGTISFGDIIRTQKESEGSISGTNSGL